MNLIVTGAQRSGTTIMAMLLNLHPWVKVLTESHQMIRFDKMLKCKDREDEYVEADAPSLWGIYCAYQEEMNRDGLVRSLCASVRGQWWHYKIFGDKSPAYCFHWQRVKELWPECNIIVMRRDFQECAESIQRCWWGSDDISLCMDRVLKYYGALDGCPGSYQVHLDRLKEHPNVVMAYILDHLKLPLDMYPFDKCVEMVNGPNVNPVAPVNPYEVVPDGEDSQ